MLAASQLDALRHVGDPLADEVAVEMRRRRELGEPIGLLRELVADGFPPAVELWDHVWSVPEWADFSAMEPAFEVALQNVIPSGLSLLAGSLVESYASDRGAKVLAQTGRLRTDTVRRLFETAKFVSDLALCRGAQPGNRAWRNVVAVRLMHAHVRIALRDRPGWDHDRWGLPVNQEDYGATLFMFSHVYRRSLERLGVRQTEEERFGSHLNWRYVGWLMGVEPELLSADPQEEAAMYHASRERNYSPDDDSRALAHSLLDAMAKRPPFFLSRAGLHSLSRRLVGDELGDALQLERSKTWDRVIDASTVVTAASGRLSRGLAPITVPAGEHLTSGIVAFGLPRGTRFAAD